MNKNLPILVIAIVVIVGAIVFLSGGLGGGSEPSPFVPADGGEQIEGKVRLEVGKEAPNFELENFDGETLSLAEFRGKPVMVDFWADWCPFCTGEMPIINEVFNEFNGELVVLGIHRTATESLQTGKDFADELGISYPLLQDKTDEVYKAYGRGQQFMPLAVFIDENGVVVSTKAGPKTAEEIRENVKELMTNEQTQ